MFTGVLRGPALLKHLAYLLYRFIGDALLSSALFADDEQAVLIERRDPLMIARAKHELLTSNNRFAHGRIASHVHPPDQPPDAPSLRVPAAGCMAIGAHRREKVSAATPRPAMLRSVAAYSP